MKKEIKEVKFPSVSDDMNMTFEEYMMQNRWQKMGDLCEMNG